MKIAALIFLATITSAFAADPSPSPAQPLTMGAAAEEYRAQWRAMEPRLFTDAAFAKQQTGKVIEAEGKPVSFGAPLVVRTADGVIFRASHMQKGDLDELASFHKKPTEAWVRGEITGIDAATRTVYIKAVSVNFGP